MPNTISLDAIDHDMDSYPRKEPRQSLIAEYTGALRGGNTFPPIILETGTIKLLSGLHRIKAYEAANKEPELLENGFQPSDSIEVDYLDVPEELRLYRRKTWHWGTPSF